MNKLFSLLLFVAFSLYSLPSFGLGSLAQAPVLGNHTSSTTTCSSTGITTTANYGSNTTSGNTLVLVVWLHATTTSVNSFNVTPTTSGVTWHNNGLTGTVHDSSTSTSFGSLIYFSENQSAVGSGTATSVNMTLNATACTMELALFELAGIIGSYPTNYGITSNQALSSGTPTATFSAPSGTGFVISTVCTEGGSTLTAGGGYTLGPTSVAITVAQTEYAAGQSSTATASYSATSGTGWYTSALWFMDGAPAATSVSRHRGFIN